MTNFTNESKNHQSENNKKKKFNLKNLEARYMKLRESKIFIASIFTLVGVSIATLVQSVALSKESVYTKQQVKNLQIWSDDFERIMEEQRKILSSFDHDPFFENPALIFAEMNQIQKRMNDIFADQHKHMTKIFDESKKNKNVKSENSSVVTRQDENNYYYELSFSGFNKEEILVSIKNGFLTFSAKKNEETKDKKSESQSSSSFSYSFSTPQYDEKIEPEITKQDGKVIVKFVKKKNA